MIRNLFSGMMQKVKMPFKMAFLELDFSSSRTTWQTGGGWQAAELEEMARENATCSGAFKNAICSGAFESTTASGAFFGYFTHPLALSVGYFTHPLLAISPVRGASSSFKAGSSSSSSFEAGSSSFSFKAGSSSSSFKAGSSSSSEHPPSPSKPFLLLLLQSQASSFSFKAERLVALLLLQSRASLFPFISSTEGPPSHANFPFSLLLLQSRSPPPPLHFLCRRHTLPRAPTRFVASPLPHFLYRRTPPPTPFAVLLPHFKRPCRIPPTPSAAACRSALPRCCRPNHTSLSTIFADPRHIVGHLGIYLSMVLMSYLLNYKLKLENTNYINYYKIDFNLCY